MRYVQVCIGLEEDIWAQFPCGHQLCENCVTVRCPHCPPNDVPAAGPARQPPPPSRRGNTPTGYVRRMVEFFEAGRREEHPPQRGDHWRGDYRGRPLAEVSASRRGRASRAKLTAAPFGFALSADDAMMTMNSCGSRGEMGHSSAGAALGSSRLPPPAAPTLSYRPLPRLGFVRRQRSSRPRVWATRRPPTPNMTVGLHAFASAARRT